MTTYNLPKTIDIFGYNFDAIRVTNINWETNDSCNGYYAWVNVDTPNTDIPGNELHAEVVGFDCGLHVTVDGGYEDGRTLLEIKPFH